jgi:uncharacterized protein (DUF697 family)
MTRKPLPKAITRTSADLQEIVFGSATDQAAAARRSALAFDAVEAEPVLAVAPLPAALGAARPLTIAPPLTAGDAAASAHADAQAAKRRSLARKIVDRHKLYAAGGGLVPVPIVNVAGVTAIIMRMVKRLSDLYEVPFERARTRSMVIGLMGGAVPTGLAAATTSTLALAVPTSALVGLAVSSFSAAALTRGIGLVFVEHFESAARPLDAAAT